jgi:hypothetical protein
MLKATFTLKNLTATYLEQLAQQEPRRAYQMLRDSQRDLGHAISLKIGTGGQMQDAIDFNNAFKSDKPMQFKIEPRVGYKLATFSF